AEAEKGHTFGLTFTPDGKRLVSVGSPSVGREQGRVVLWDVASRGGMHATTTKTAAGGTHRVRAVAVSSDERTVAYGTDAGDLRLMSLDPWGKTISVKLSGVSGLSFSKNSTTLAVATYKDVVVIDRATGTETKRFEPGCARQVVFAPDGQSVWV